MPGPSHMRAPLSRTLYDLLEEQAGRAPDAPAVIGRGGALSFAALAGRARALAGALHERGVRRGTPVASIINNRVEFLEVLFGVTALGAVLAPLSTWSTRGELDFLLRDSGARVLFTLDRLGERCFADDVAALLDGDRAPVVEQVFVLDGEPRAGWCRYDELLVDDSAPPLAPGAAASAGDAAMVLYTSGSSSRPKAVPLDQHAIIENGFNIGERQGLAPGDRVFLPVPLFWSYAAANALPAAMSHGAALVLQERFEAEEALALIETHACTALYTLPAITNALLAAPGFRRERTRTLRTGLTIGSPQDVIRTARELGAGSICNIYGSTETYGNCCVTPCGWPLERRARSQGPPLPGVRLRVRDPDTGAPCPPGTVGALEVRGYLTRGYAGDSARFNDEVFTGDGWFRTGDLACLDDAGCVVYSGRSTEMIKRSGINVSPAEVEEVLQQHPDVGLAGVTGTPDAARGEAIVAFVVRRPGAQVADDALRAHCREHLSGYKIPDRIEFRDSLPLTPTGKLLRKELRSLAAAVTADA